MLPSIRTAGFLGLLLLVGVALGAREGVADSTIDISHALSVIEQHESRIQSLRFHCVHSTGRPTPDHEPFSLAGRAFGSIESDVAIDTVQMHYRLILRIQQNAEAIDDSGTITHGISFSEQGFTNDGRIWSRYIQPHVGIPPDGKDDWSSRITREAIICNSADEALYADGGGVITQYGSRIGIGWMPPFVCTPGAPPARLSEYIRTRVDNPQFHVECVRNDDGVWQIWLGTRRDIPTTAGLLLAYAPDPGRIESIELGPADRVSTPGTFPYWRILYKYENAAALIPAGVCYLPPPGGSDAAIWEFTEVAMNENLPPETFSPDIPHGTEVTDYIGQKIYTVGRELADDDAAVAEFMERIHGTKTPPPKPVSYGWRHVLIGANLAIAALVACCVGLLRLSRRRANRGNIVSGVLFALLLFKPFGTDLGDTDLGDTAPRRMVAPLPPCCQRVAANLGAHL